MSTQETYALDGGTRFDFPHPVRVKSQLTVEVKPGDVVPPSEYEVVGYGPNATGVTVYWPGAPTDDDLELRITRFTEPDRVTKFTDGTPVQPSALDAEFDNLFQLYVDMPNYVQLAEDWANEEEDTEVSDGKYSALHWAQKAQEWAENPEDEETYDGGYSARHYSAKAEASADDAKDSELQAKQYKEYTSDLHESVQDTVEQFESGYTGFDEDHGYDFGYVTDETTYFDRDFGTIA